MFESVDIGEMLDDLRSVKLKPDQRLYVDNARRRIQANGDIPTSVKSKIRKLCSSYSVQIKELKKSRERARRTNYLRKNGVTLAQATRIVNDRAEEVANSKNDLGF